MVDFLRLEPDVAYLIPVILVPQQLPKRDIQTTYVTDTIRSVSII